MYCFITVGCVKVLQYKLVPYFVLFVYKLILIKHQLRQRNTTIRITNLNLHYYHVVNVEVPELIAAVIILMATFHLLFSEYFQVKRSKRLLSRRKGRQ